MKFNYCQVIDAFILPMALILSRIILKTHYRKNHIVGVVACLLGCGSLVGADYLIKGDSGTILSSFVVLFSF